MSAELLLEMGVTLGSIAVAWAGGFFLGRAYELRRTRRSPEPVPDGVYVGGRHVPFPAPLLPGQRLLVTAVPMDDPRGEPAVTTVQSKGHGS